MEKTQEGAFQFLLNDKRSSYSSLLEMSKQTTLHLTRIKQIACEVYKSLNQLNPTFMTTFLRKEIFLIICENAVF